MPFDPMIAATRFGTGLSPVIEPPWDVPQMLTILAGPDETADRLPISGFAQTVPSLKMFSDSNAARRTAETAAARAEADARTGAMRRDMNAVHRHNLSAVLARGVVAKDGLRERLTMFWADHFTVKSRNFAQRHLVTPYVEDAIRPHVTGRFGDMVMAVVTHPMMLLYLEQTRSVGPNSEMGQRLGRGLNENLARELLELHLVGVNGGYTQDDVTELAELLTGLNWQPRHDAAVYDPKRAEPGAEVVMGRRYSADADMSSIAAALNDIASRPRAARHVAQKLAVHFVSDTPDPDHVTAMARAFVDSGGDLMAVVGAMLNHPAAWVTQRQKVRRPDLFMTAALRALGTRADRIMALEMRDMTRHVTSPLALMGQPAESPGGPDGWSESAAAWITPQGLAARISWALQSPAVFVDTLPDPRDFVRTAIGPAAPAEVIFAATSAESLSDGIGIVLTSPAFQRI